MNAGGHSFPRALVLAGSRSLNKRIALFLTSLRESGFDPVLLTIPRHRWRLSALEDLAAAWTCGFTTLRTNERSKRWRRPRLIVCMHWSLLPLATIVTWLVGGRVLYDEHDHYALLALEGAGPRSVRQIRSWWIGIIHRWCLPHVDVVSCIRLAGGALATHLQHYASQVVELHNYPSRRWRPPMTAVEGPLAIVYAGGLWSEKGGHHIIDAFIRLSADASGALTGLHVFGTGDPDIEQRLRRTPGVCFHGDSRYEAILSCLGSHTCIGLNLLENTPRYRQASTNCTKLFEYLATGTPVLVTAVGELPDIIAKAGGGWTIDADFDGASLALRLREILADREYLRRRGAAAAAAVEREGWHWEQEWQKLKELGILDLPVAQPDGREDCATR